MHLGIDFDGTVTAAAGMQRAYAAKRWGVELDERQVMRAGAVPVLGAERYGAMGEALWGPLTAFTPPQDDALRVLGQLSERHEVTIVTARSDHQAAFARRWLSARGLGMRVVNTSPAPKTAICAALGIDLLLDDDIVRYSSALHVAGTPPVLFEQPHDRGLERPEGLLAVEDWTSFAELVRGLDGV